MLGTPRSSFPWHRINAIAGGLLFGAAILPLATLNLWSRPRARPFLLIAAWIVAVTCTTHALVGIIQRVSSLAGILAIDYPLWETIDRKQADMQALLFNEPWFLVEGLLWVVIAWCGALAISVRRHWWVGSGLAVIAAATAIGLLSAFGVLGRVIIG